MNVETPEHSNERTRKDQPDNGSLPAYTDQQRGLPNAGPKEPGIICMDLTSTAHSQVDDHSWSVLGTAVEDREKREKRGEKNEGPDEKRGNGVVLPSS